MVMDKSHSEAEATTQNGIDGDDHDEEPLSDDLNDVDDADLFGDGSEAGGNGQAFNVTNSEKAVTAKSRKIDDKELDSGDDEGRRDRLGDDVMEGYGDDEEYHGEARSLNVADVRLARHPVPCPSDGEVLLAASFHACRAPSRLTIYRSYTYSTCPNNLASSQDLSTTAPLSHLRLAITLTIHRPRHFPSIKPQSAPLDGVSPLLIRPSCNPMLVLSAGKTAPSPSNSPPTPVNSML